MLNRIYKNHTTSSYNEVWKRIKNYPDYMISNEGRVISYRRYPSKPQIIGSIAGNYKTVTLYNDKGSETHLIHVLMTEAFIGPRPSKNYVCNHKDGIKLNNDIDNFEWITRREDALHAFRLGLRDNSNHIKLKNEKLRRNYKKRELQLMMKLLRSLYQSRQMTFSI